MADLTHYLNTDFDVSLRPRPRQLERQGLARQVDELSVQGVLGADGGDSVLIRAEVPEPFLTYLDRCGLPVPRLLAHPQIDSTTRLAPFGWSAEAIELNRRHVDPVDHPPLSTVRRVNARSFALELEAELFAGTSAGAVVASVDELEAYLSDHGRANGWVVKAEHGNSALANHRLAEPYLSEVDRRFVEGRLAEDDRLIVEPWLSRERDWSVVFEVPFESRTLRIHETIGTRDGALIGALFAPAGDGTPHDEELASASGRIARRLEEEGYFGPVCLDAFSWHDGDRLRLRPLVDLNCRRSMSDGAYRLWRQTAPEHTLYYRFFNRRRLELPGDVRQTASALADDAYDPARRRGTLLASPLEYGKLAVVFLGSDRREVFELERRFRERFEA